MIAFGSFWHHLTAFDNFWQLITAYHIKWKLMTTFDSHPVWAAHKNFAVLVSLFEFFIRRLLHAYGWVPYKILVKGLSPKSDFSTFGFGSDSLGLGMGLWFGLVTKPCQTNDRPMYLWLDTPWLSPCIFVGNIEFALSIFGAQGCKTDINFLNQNNESKWVRIIRFFK